MTLECLGSPTLESPAVRAGEGSVLATLAYASPMIWSSSVPESVSRDLQALVEAERFDRVARDAAAVATAFSDA